VRKLKKRKKKAGKGGERETEPSLLPKWLHHQPKRASPRRK
jgi:hypothetical protein